MKSFWENEIQRLPVDHLKGQLHKFPSSWLHFMPVRLPVRDEACGCVIVPRGELFQRLNGQCRVCVSTGVCNDDEAGADFDVCSLQYPQTAGLAELLQPLRTGESGREVRLRPEPRRLQLHHRRRRVSFTPQMLVE